MELDLETKTIIEEKAKKYDIKSLLNASKTISDNYNANKNDGSHLLTGEIGVAAYAITRMPATFGAISFALEALISKRK